MRRLLSLSFIAFLALLLSCQNQNAENSIYDAASDSSSITGLTGDSVKLVKTAGIRFKVKDVVQSTRAISNIVHQFGGMIYHQDLEAIEVETNKHKLSSDSVLLLTSVRPQAQITARIPSQQLEAFMYSVADIGYFISSAQLHVDDKSLAYLENSLKHKNRKEVLAYPNHSNKNFTGAIETISIKDKAIEQQIANKAIDADVQYSMVSLTLFQNVLVQKEITANDELSDYQLPFTKRLYNAISEGWFFFLSFIVTIAHLWMFFVLALLLILLYKYWQRNKLAA